MNYFQGHLQLTAECNPELLRFCNTSLCDWSKNLAPLPKPIRCKTKTNHNLIIRVSPLFGRFACLYFEFSVAIYGDISLLGLHGCCDCFGSRFTKFNRTVLYLWNPNVTLNHMLISGCFGDPYLGIEREILDVHLTRAVQDHRCQPHVPTSWVDYYLCMKLIHSTLTFVVSAKN